MKRLCGWCSRELDQAKPGDNQGVTHGICPECRPKQFASVRLEGRSASASLAGGGDGNKPASEDTDRGVTSGDARCLSSGCGSGHRTSTIKRKAVAPIIRKGGIVSMLSQHHLDKPDQSLPSEESVVEVSVLLPSRQIACWKRQPRAAD